MHCFSFLCFCEQQDPLSPSPYTALILHRLALDCGFEAQNLGFNCTTTEGQVSIIYMRLKCAKIERMTALMRLVLLCLLEQRLV